VIHKLDQDWIDINSVIEHILKRRDLWRKKNQNNDHLSFQKDSFVNLRAIDYNLEEVLKLVAWLATLMQAVQQTTTYNQW